MDFINDVIKNVDIDEGEQAIENLLTEVYFKEGISTKELARRTLLPVPLATAIKREFIKAGAIIQDRGVRLSNEGREFVEKELGFGGLNLELYNRLMNNQWDWNRDFEEEREELKGIFDSRPGVDVTIDQSKCTVETSLKRAVLCLQNHSLIGKDILCVGDDDLVSISICFLLRKLYNDFNNNRTSIHIVDMDERFLSHIKEVSERGNFPVVCHCTDLRRPLPEKLVEGFDCFFTDPPYTLSGMRLFLSRGISGLKKGTGLPIFFSFAHKAPGFTLNMQRELLNMGLMISEILPRFNEYEGAEIIGNTGQIMVLKTTENTVPVIEGEFNETLYTGEEKRTIRTYKCKNCGEVFKIGFREECRTIEELKEKGCTNCGNHTFDLIDRVQIEFNKQ